MNDLKPKTLTYAHLFRVAVEGSDLGVWIHDIPTDHLTWSDRLYETLGVHKDVVPRLDILQSLIHPDDKDWVGKEIADCLANKTPYSVEYRSIRPDNGETVWLRCTGEALLDASGATFVMLGTTFDITHLKTAEFKAKAADRAKSEFLANMSHEIRTPMNGILGMCQVLEQTELTADQSDLLKIIESSGDTLLKMINDILDFSQLNSGKLTLASAPFDLITCIENVTTLLKNTHHKASDFELLVRVQPDFPVHYLGDADRLRQVITSLMSNAFKFTENGHVLLDLSGRVENGIATLKFLVEDTGIGIPKEKIEKIFDRFEQVDNSRKRQYGGTGLGLAMAKQIIDLMGGELQVESELGTGSQFRFEIAMPVHASADATSSQSAPVPPANILIIDDNAISQRILREQITHWTWTPTSALSVREGLMCLKNAVRSDAAFDLILLDSEMPVCNSEDFLKILRKHTAFDAVEVIVMSSADLPDSGQKIKTLGAADYLIKPPQMPTLYRAIRKILDNKPKSQTVFGERSKPRREQRL